MAILISSKIHFKSKKVIRDKEGCHILMKDSIQQEDMTVTNIYALNGRPSESMEQKLIESEREIKDSTVIIGDFNICSLMHLAKSTSLQRPSLLRG